MASFVLVHGAWHGGWCWSRVIEALRRDGHRVVAPDLPGHGADPTPIGAVTLDDYAERIQAACESFAEPVVLVGHSMGGIVITRVAERVPECVEALVYLAAFLPEPGQSLLDLARRDAESRIAGNIVLVEEGRASVLPVEVAPAVFYADCAPEVAADASRRLCATALQPMAAPVEYSAERFGRVRRIYIECARDAAVSPALQRQIHASVPFERVVRLDASHSPFLSMPGALADVLVSVAG
jgi:pimeloyl-ACP methyl ester carboxylesterase